MSNKDIEEISINLTKEQAEDLKKAFGLDELKEIHNRFENGTETIEDIKNHCLNYVIKNENGLELRVVEVKYFEKLIEHIDQLENILADRERLEKENNNIKKILKRDIRECRSGVITTQGNKQRKELTGAQRRHIASLSGRQNEAIRILNILEGETENENK